MRAGASRAENLADSKAAPNVVLTVVTTAANWASQMAVSKAVRTADSRASV